MLARITVVNLFRAVAVAFGVGLAVNVFGFDTDLATLQWLGMAVIFLAMLVGD